jgi:hypothetical protein
MSRDPSPSPDDVEKLIRGKPSKSRSGSRQIRHRLRQDELKRLAIARERGFLLLTPSTRTALRNAWWLDCQSRSTSCIYVERTQEGLVVTGAGNLDNIHRTLSTLEDVAAFAAHLQQKA